jgi:hypothetical protein
MTGKPRGSPAFTPIAMGLLALIRSLSSAARAHGTELAQSKAAILCASTLAAIVGLAMMRVVAVRGA